MAHLRERAQQQVALVSIACSGSSTLGESSSRFFLSLSHSVCLSLSFPVSLSLFFIHLSLVSLNEVYMERECELDL